MEFSDATIKCENSETKIIPLKENRKQEETIKDLEWHSNVTNFVTYTFQKNRIQPKIEFHFNFIAFGKIKCDISVAINKHKNFKIYVNMIQFTKNSLEKEW